MDRNSLSQYSDSEFLKKVSDIQEEFSKENDYKVNLALLRELLIITERHIKSSKGMDEKVLLFYRNLIDSTKESIEILYSIGQEVEALDSI